MQRKRSSVLAWAAALVSLGCLVPWGLSAQLTPVGSEVRADTYPGSPSCPHLAVAADRSFEIVWDYNGIDSFSVFGRHFSPSGEPTNAVQVQFGSDGDFYDYNVADLVTAVPDGFQVFITNVDSNLERPPVDFRQRVNLTGMPVGAVETLKITPSFLVGPDGSLYAVYFQARPKNLVAQPVSPDGTPQGRRIVLNTRPVDAPRPETRLAPLGGGDFVALWNGVSMARPGVRARQVLRGRIVHQGVPQGQDFDVNVSPGGAPDSPPFLGYVVVASSPSARELAAVWPVTDAAGATSIHLRFFDASGRPLTGETVAVPSAKPVFLLSAALDDAGRLLLLWRPPQNVLRARLFSPATGAPLGPAYQVGPAPQPFCGDVAWDGSSWLMAYWSGGSDGRGAIVWLRLAG
ncbi:MAG TPA: hypothetical protein VGH73_13195 [Thermoanaerobaculia bacterium]